ncbi:MAG: hypothetical protein QF752_06210, partial [Planctomycetota bacterium]|nr:hypothetical protein [Planctomycetota bacterium]
MGPQILLRQDLEILLGQSPGTLVLVEPTEEHSSVDFRRDESEMEILQETLLHHLPAETSVARYGGRILAVWLPRFEPNQARASVQKGLEAVDFSTVLGATHCAEEEESAALIDRADRSLSRAREHPPWALWNPELDKGRRRADPLAGIFSSQSTRTYRNVRFLLDTIHSITGPQTLSQILSTSLSRM